MNKLLKYLKDFIHMIKTQTFTLKKYIILLLICNFMNILPKSRDSFKYFQKKCNSYHIQLT